MQDVTDSIKSVIKVTLKIYLVAQNAKAFTLFHNVIWRPPRIASKITAVFMSWGWRQNVASFKTTSSTNWALRRHCQQPRNVPQYAATNTLCNKAANAKVRRKTHRVVWASNLKCGGKCRNAFVTSHGTMNTLTQADVDHVLSIRLVQIWRQSIRKNGIGFEIKMNLTGTFLTSSGYKVKR